MNSSSHHLYNLKINNRAFRILCHILTPRAFRITRNPKMQTASADRAAQTKKACSPGPQAKKIES